MATATSVARGALWNYSAQIVTVLVQFGYAAVTSRLLEPHSFGVFAAALASAQLINLVALAGLPQVVGRMTELEPGRLAGLLLYAVGVGVTAAGTAILSAPLWAAVWRVPESAAVIRVLAVTSFLTPLIALGNGLCLRLGIFRRLALRTVSANIAGMAVGVAAVVLLRSTLSLTVSQITSQLAVAVLVLAGCREWFHGRPRRRQLLIDIRYSALTLVSALLTYTAGTVGRLAVSQGLGTVPLGNWNRADALTTTPFYLLGQAVSQAVFPEFRHDITDRSRTERVWSDLLGSLAWVLVPLGTLVSVIAPIAVRVLLGDGWALAAGYASVLAIIGALQPLVFLLVSAFEALGRFRWNWGGYAMSLVVNLVAAGIALALHDIRPVFAGTLVAFALFHGLHLTLAARAGLIDLRRVLTHYGQVAVFAAALAVLLLTAVHLPLVISISPLLPVAVAAGAAVGGAVLVRHLDRFPPVRLARSYGVLRRAARPTERAAR